MSIDDKVNPAHYKQHESGVECIDITEWMNFNLGNVVKYVWRADLKGEGVYDLEKAKWYLDRELKRRVKIAEKEKKKNETVDNRFDLTGSGSI
jgi:Protein of unknwon function (DUF3310)